MRKGIFKFLASTTLRTVAPRASISITSIRAFSGTRIKMSDLTVELTAPNGRKYKQPIGIFINNEFVKSKSGEKITSINPTYAAALGLNRSVIWTIPTDMKSYSTETEITSVYAAGADDVDVAVAAARKAFKNPSWRDMASTDRGNLMMKLSELVEQHAETLATIETWDNGQYYPSSLIVHSSSSVADGMESYRQAIPSRPNRGRRRGRGRAQVLRRLRRQDPRPGHQHVPRQIRLHSP